MNDATVTTPEYMNLAAQLLEQALELLNNGGAVMFVLAVLSVVALTIILVKLWQFKGIHSTGVVENSLQSWRAGREQEAIDAVSSARYPVADVVAVAMDGKMHQQLTEGSLREEVTRIASRHLEALRSHLRGLEIIAALSPLLGLLGTVLGMIEAFQQLETAGTRANPATLSGGIWEALLTTAAGLIVAIPTIAAVHWFERRIDRVRHAMEDAVTRVFTTPPPTNQRQTVTGEVVEFKADHAH
ncbi:MAG: MotA/TolQ/ExbB proton channel family protein [Gammaproteobacteria bacterium]|nr:MotA/TolQ/ExbB proton channel family protein [Gammaproteobacteria bacterium]